jgi:hypothetical protein
MNTIYQLYFKTVSFQGSARRNSIGFPEQQKYQMHNHGTDKGQQPWFANTVDFTAPSVCLLYPENNPLLLFWGCA